MIETPEQLQETIQELVQLTSGVNTVILANQGEAPPVGLYATYNINPVRAYGQPRQVVTNIAAVEPIPDFEWTDYNFATITAMEFLISVNFFNNGAKAAAMRLPKANFRPPINEYLFAHNLAWRYTSEIRNLTGLDSAKLQQRQQVDIHLWAETKIDDVVLKAAGFNVEIVDENGNILAGA